MKKRITKPTAATQPERSFDKDGEIYARLLEDKRTPESFRKAFGSLFIECLLAYSGVQLTEPQVLRVLLPFVMEHLNEDYGETMLESLMHIRDALIPDEVVEKVLAETHKLFEHRAICGCKHL